MKKYSITPATNRQVTEFYKRQDSSMLEWSSVLLANLLQVTNGKNNTQQINRSLFLETTRFKNGNLKQHGQSILAYLLHVIEVHNVGIKWKDNRFQFVESVTLDIESVIPFHLWIAEQEAEAEDKKEKAAKEKAEAEAETKRLKEEKAAADKAKKVAEKAAAEAKKVAEKAAADKAEATSKAEAEAAAAAEAEALEVVKVEESKAAEAKAEANHLDQAIKAERDRLIATGGGAQAKGLLLQLKRALLAGIQGGTVSELLAIAEAAKELQILATGLAMDEKAKVEADAALQLVDVKPSSASRSGGLKVAV